MAIIENDLWFDEQGRFRQGGNSMLGPAEVDTSGMPHFAMSAAVPSSAGGRDGDGPEEGNRDDPETGGTLGGQNPGSSSGGGGGWILPTNDGPEGNAGRGRDSGVGGGSAGGGGGSAGGGPAQRPDVRAPDYPTTPPIITIDPGDLPLEEADFSAWDLECLRGAYDRMNALFMGNKSDEDPERKSIFSRKNFEEWLLSPFAHMISGLQKSGYIDFGRLDYFNERMWDNNDPQSIEDAYANSPLYRRIIDGINFWGQWIKGHPTPVGKPMLDEKDLKKMYDAFLSKDERYQRRGSDNSRWWWSWGHWTTTNRGPGIERSSEISPPPTIPGWQEWFNNFTRDSGWGELLWLLYEYHICVRKKKKEREKVRKELEGRGFGVGLIEGDGWAFGGFAN